MANTRTRSLGTYPSEALAQLRRQREAQGLPVFDLGVGDLSLPLWEAIPEAVVCALSHSSRYPSIAGSDSLDQAHRSYLQRCFALSADDLAQINVVPTRGSKEAIFHTALSLVEPGVRDRIYYPSPGYPVYACGALFAGATAHSYPCVAWATEPWQPWDDPAVEPKRIAAIWVNFPHNPTGQVAGRAQLLRLLDWCQEHGIVLLSDECYIDLYLTELAPPSLLAVACEAGRAVTGLVCYFSLSKRSGMTGYRAGFMAGDPQFLRPHLGARANFGLAQPQFVQRAAEVAWGDEDHVAKRREILRSRVSTGLRILHGAGWEVLPPAAGCYLWCRVPEPWQGDDEALCYELARDGVLATPGRWMGPEGQGYLRLSLAEHGTALETALSVCITTAQRQKN